MAGTERTNSETHAAALKLLLMHRHDLFTFILAMARSMEVAEEIFQETALIISRDHKHFEPGSNFMAWARSIARNKIMEQHRESRRDLRFSSRAMDNLEAASDRVAGCEGHLDALRRCLVKVGEKGSRILQMRYRDQTSCSVISSKLKMTLPAIYMTLSRLRTKLAACIRQELAIKKGSK